MWMFVFEAALALALLLFIVWWTMAPVRKREMQKGQKGQKQQGQIQAEKPDNPL